MNKKTARSTSLPITENIGRLQPGIAEGLPPIAAPPDFNEAFEVGLFSLVLSLEAAKKEHTRAGALMGPALLTLKTPWKSLPLLADTYPPQYHAAILSKNIDRQSPALLLTDLMEPAPPSPFVIDGGLFSFVLSLEEQRKNIDSSVGRAAQPFPNTNEKQYPCLLTPPKNSHNPTITNAPYLCRLCTSGCISAALIPYILVT